MVGEAADGEAAVDMAAKIKPSVVLMDICLPRKNGIDATAEIRELLRRTRVAILSMYANVEHICRAFRAGATGYILKESAGVEVVDAVRTVAKRLKSTPLPSMTGLLARAPRFPSPRMAVPLETTAIRLPRLV